MSQFDKNLLARNYKKEKKSKAVALRYHSDVSKNIKNFDWYLVHQNCLSVLEIFGRENLPLHLKVKNTSDRPQETVLKR